MNKELEAFATAFGVMAEVFNEPVTDVKIAAYWDSLRDLDGEAVVTAMSENVKHSKFFPRPADIRELVEGTKWDRSNQKVAELRRQIVSVGRYGKPTLSPEMEMAVYHMGGWRSVCNMDLKTLEYKFHSAWRTANALGKKKEIEERKDTAALCDSDNLPDKP